mmetsp:Transcript_2057/g.9056  ORF Transcript_2057/g.9056 Transcript_2057/m.9056 type:complete len:273 (+) Transcript_2057:407-1225(+)
MGLRRDVSAEDALPEEDRDAARQPRVKDRAPGWRVAGRLDGERVVQVREGELGVRQGTHSKAQVIAEGGLLARLHQRNAKGVPARGAGGEDCLGLPASLVEAPDVREPLVHVVVVPGVKRRRVRHWEAVQLLEEERHRRRAVPKLPVCLLLQPPWVRPRPRKEEIPASMPLPIGALAQQLLQQTQIRQVLLGVPASHVGGLQVEQKLPRHGQQEGVGLVRLLHEAVADDVARDLQRKGVLPGPPDSQVRVGYDRGVKAAGGVAPDEVAEVRW